MDASIGSVLLSILTLSALEIVLGIDNIIFISIIAERLPSHQREKARRYGLLLALGARVALLFAITWILGLTKDLFEIAGNGFSGRDLILLSGGLFLIYKTGTEIWEKVIPKDDEAHITVTKEGFGQILFQIMLIDIVFSFDSILTAVGIVKEVWIMIVAVVISMGVMLLFANSIAAFVHKYAGIKMLALVFLIAIGVILVAEGFEFHIEKSFIYFAMAFSLIVELLNIQSRKALLKKQVKE